MFYSHDTYGLGHVRRTLCIAHALVRHAPDFRVLIASGSPVLHRLAVDPAIEILQLLPVVKRAAGVYEARDGRLNAKAVIAHRSRQLLGAVRFFRPDVMVVDHAPIGMKGELLEALRYVRRELPETKTLLGLRDIVDAPSVVRRTWTDDHVYEALHDLYDRILVYGERSHFALDEAYALPTEVKEKLSYAGYIRKNEEILPAELVRAQLQLAPDAPFVLATVGGGGDGAALLDQTIAALALLRRRSPKLAAVIVTGPLMTESERDRIRHAAAFIGGIRVTSFFAHMTSAMAAASVTVAMGGYNTVTELLSIGSRSVIVPRMRPRKEQLIRARILARSGLVRMVEPEQLEPGAIAESIERCLSSRTRAWHRDRIEMRGTDQSVANIIALASARGHGERRLRAVQGR
jgi:predicted glycosyltransferase